MKVLLRLASPKTDKEQVFRAEAEIDDLRNPGEGLIWIDGNEYVVEVYYNPESCSGNMVA